MNYGLYLSASGVLTSMHRQDVIANNLANVSTMGFKRSMADVGQRPTEVVEDHLDPNLSNRLLEKLGGGVLVSRSRIDNRPGALQSTGNPLDVAVRGDGFFAIRDEKDKQNAVKLTRDGRFNIDNDGHLVTVTGGNKVLDNSDQPITLRKDQPVTIDKLGNCMQGGAVAGRIKLVAITNPSELTANGGGLFTASPATLKAAQAGAGEVVQGVLEQSNVDPVREMLGMLDTTRSVNFSAQLMKYHDTAMESAINQLGRVA